MFNNINDMNKDLLYAQLSSAKNVIDLASVKSALQKNSYSTNPYVDKTEISLSAMQLFQRDMDISKFAKIAASNPEDNSFLERMQELFSDGVIDPFEDDVISELANNAKLWDDLKK